MIDLKERLECSKCIMDSFNDPDIKFDENGICNHCLQFDVAFNKFPKGSEKKLALESMIDKIKKNGLNKKYDCLLGVSGGVDSSYLAYLCKLYDLRPLIIHFDNGWNSELATNNIQHILSKLQFDFQTHVINWEEFKDLQLSYFKAGVVDLEFPTDHAIMASMFHIAKQHRIKYVLSGHNIVTEGTYLPKSWVHSKLDYINLKDIHSKYGKLKLNTYPYLSFLKKLYYNFIVKFEYVQLLNYVDYNKEVIKKKLVEELSWRDYGGKHFESIFTRFYQGYILPNKFQIDKRRFHYSCLIQSKQITKEDAIQALKKPIYNPEMLITDKEFVLKKLDFTDESFEKYMKSPIKKHSDFKTEDKLWNRYFKLIKFFKPLKKLFSKP
jgi:N-acetyl sugar amidotransferase